MSRSAIITIIIALSYALGSIPFGYLLVRIFRGVDVRQSGSGNIGATNVSRTSPTLGVFTLLLDASKGAAAVALAYVVAQRITSRAPGYSCLALAGTCAIIGHIFPVWLRFRGGKGVATALGSFVLLAPEAVIITAVVFALVLLVFRYVSLGSVIAAASFPFSVWFIHQLGVSSAGIMLISFSSLLIIARHHDNIRRLLAHTEPRLGENKG